MARLHYVRALYGFHTGAGEDEKGNRVKFYKHALDAARIAVDLDPMSAEAHAELASALKTQKLYDEAIAASQSALRLNANYEEAYTNLATLKKDIGEWD